MSSLSDYSSILESDEEESHDLEKNRREPKKVEVENNDFDDDESSSDSEPDSPQQHRGSYTTSWPQSYRQSMDIYSSIPSPAQLGNLAGSFLGGGSLSKVSGSYLSSSLTKRRHTPEVLPVLPSVQEPLLTPKAEEEKQLPAFKKIPSKKQIVETAAAAPPQLVADVHGLPVTACGFGHALFNSINVLCGVGILSTPYAVKEGGWLGMAVLFAFAILAGYTGHLLKTCLQSKSKSKNPYETISTYPDIGQAAFGFKGRLLVSIILYAELYACCIEYIILESDNLSSMFPHAHFDFAGIHLDSHKLFAILTTLAVLPTTWLKDLSILSYISAGGVIASILAFGSLLWLAGVEHAELKYPGKLLDLSNLPIALGLYGYCYSGHAVYPNIYTSMRNTDQFMPVLILSFVICTLMYAGTAVVGYMMFGEAIQSQFTLNMSTTYSASTASRVAVWTTVVNPFTKYALTITPVALSLEELLPSDKHCFSIIIRSLLVFSTLTVALVVPFFGYVMSLIGSLLTMLVVFILPCACYLAIIGEKVSTSQRIMCILVILVGSITALVGSYSSIKGIVNSMIKP